MHRTLRKASLAVTTVTLLAMCVLATACGGGDDDPSPTATPGATESPTTNIPSPMPGTLTPTSQPGTPATAPSGTTATIPPTKRTGVPELDSIIAIVTSGSPASVLANIEPAKLACTTAQGAGGPPKCATGEANGTVVSVFPHGGCEVGYVRGEALQALLTELSDSAVAKSAFDLTSTTANVLGASKGIVFEVKRNGATAGLLVAVNEQGKITGTWAGCGNIPAADLLAQQKGGTVYLQ